jgi:hypothetical protein
LAVSCFPLMLPASLAPLRHWVYVLAGEQIEDLLPVSLALAKDDALAIIRDAVDGVPRDGHGNGVPRDGHGNGMALQVTQGIYQHIYQHWLSKRRSRGHFISRHHVVALQVS